MIDQLTVVFGLLVTLAVKDLGCPPNSVTFLGATVMLTGVTVTVAVPQVCATHVGVQGTGTSAEQAVIWTDCWLETGGFAVYTQAFPEPRLTSPTERLAALEVGRSETEDGEKKAQDLDKFLQSLKNLWRKGEVHPTHG